MERGKPRKSFAHAVGPCAGKPPARFDEGSEPKTDREASSFPPHPALAYSTRRFCGFPKHRTMKLPTIRMIVIGGVVLLVAFISHLFLGHPWFRAVLYKPVGDGRFVSAFGMFLFELLFGLPFFIPFVFGGFLLTRFSSTRSRGLLVSATLGIAGALLFWLLHPHSPSAREVFPLLFAVAGSLGAHLSRVQRIS